MGWVCTWQGRPVEVRGQRMTNRSQLSLSFYCVNPRDQTQVIRLGKSASTLSPLICLQPHSHSTGQWYQGQFNKSHMTHSWPSVVSRSHLLT